MPSSSEKYREVFESIDKNKDGVIDLLELSNAVSGKYDFTPFRVQQLMQEADLDGDGKIDLDEFCRVMEAHRESVDHWGMASKSIWTKFWSAAQVIPSGISNFACHYLLAFFVLCPFRKLTYLFSHTIGNA